MRTMSLFCLAAALFLIPAKAEAKGHGAGRGRVVSLVRSVVRLPAIRGERPARAARGNCAAGACK